MKFWKYNKGEYIPENYLSFDDTLLCPLYSEVESRLDPDTKVSLGEVLDLTIPIISSPMDTITGPEMTYAMHNLGGLGILNKYIPTTQYCNYSICCANVFTRTRKLAISVGIDEKWIEFLKQMQYEGYGPQLICVDVAHGHMKKSLEFIRRLRKDNFCKNIMSGSICTYHAALDNIQAGATILRVGVGCGSLCSTRMVTGHGVPQLTAIIECAQAIKDSKTNTKLVADGGLRQAGDIVKALAAGADAVMLGRLLAGTDETPGDILIQDYNFKNGISKADPYIDIPSWPEKCIKKYRGQSSKDFQQANGLTKDGVAAEGEDMYVPYKGAVADVIKELVGGLKSGMSYSGARTIKELQEKAVAIEIGHNALIESKVHAKL